MVLKLIVVIVGFVDFDFMFFKVFCFCEYIEFIKGNKIKIMKFIFYFIEKYEIVFENEMI